MIIYDLRCEKEHQFEGWFRSATDFDMQTSRRLVSCPQCDSHEIRRVPSAVALAGLGTPAVQESIHGASGTSHLAAMPAGTQIMAAYRQLVRVMIANSEDVGNAFAAEARKIHCNEAPKEGRPGFM